MEKALLDIITQGKHTTNIITVWHERHNTLCSIITSDFFSPIQKIERLLFENILTEEDQKIAKTLLIEYKQLNKIMFLDINIRGSPYR